MREASDGDENVLSPVFFSNPSLPLGGTYSTAEFSSEFSVILPFDKLKRIVIDAQF